MPASTPNPATQLTAALKALAEIMARDGSVQIDVRVTVTSRRAVLDRARAVADAQRLQYERTAPPFRPYRGAGGDTRETGHLITLR
ncbi:hypothetical protein ABZ867_28995 [Streptomyces cinnamoneus]